MQQVSMCDGPRVGKCPAKTRKRRSGFEDGFVCLQSYAHSAISNRLVAWLLRASKMDKNFIQRRAPKRDVSRFDMGL